jgi:hypothetical protein
MKKFMITIPQPCGENWAAMSPVERGRFCGSCQKQVIDFSAMTDSQLAAFFKKPAASVCGRFYAGQLGRDMVVPKKQLPFIRYFFTVALPVLLLSLKAKAQKLFNERPIIVVAEQLQKDTVPAFTNPTYRDKVSGIVTDNSGKGVPFASVIISGTNIGVSCDSTGKFTLTSSHQKIEFLNVSAIGYSMTKAPVNGNEIRVVLNEPAAFLGDVVVVGYTIRSHSKSERVKKEKAAVIPAPERNISFNVYPNPVTRNSSCKINTSKLEAGVYQLTLIGNAGEASCHKEVVVDKKSQIIELNIGNAAPGPAYVQLVNMKTGKLFSEKIIIQ